MKIADNLGRLAAYQSHLIVRLTTTTGHTGLGEAYPLSFVTGGTAKTMKVIVDTELAPVITGKSIFALQAIHATMNQVSGQALGAKSAIDMAIWDMQGI